jgi:hypothetical protein
MAEPEGRKALEKTVEELRRAGVVLYNVDPDQLACIACGQQAMQATSLRGDWWHCPNGCNQKVADPGAAPPRAERLPLSGLRPRGTLCPGAGVRTGPGALSSPVSGADGLPRGVRGEGAPDHRPTEERQRRCRR